MASKIAALCMGCVRSCCAKAVYLANVYALTVGANHTQSEYAMRMEELLELTIELNRAGPHIWLSNFNVCVWNNSELPDRVKAYADAKQSASELHTARATRGPAPRVTKHQAKVFHIAAASAG